MRRNSAIGVQEYDFNSDGNADLIVSDIEVDQFDRVRYFAEVFLASPLVGITDRSGVETAFSPLRVFPNPFNSSMKVVFSVEAREHVRIAVFDILGREVAVLLESELEQGSYTVTWDARDYASGVYLLNLNSAVHVSEKILLMR
jgi:hypothetical protein